MYSYLCDAGCYTNFYTHLTGRTKAEAVVCAIFDPIASSNANNLGYLRGACGQPAHTPTKPQPHTYTYTLTHTPEEINDCDLLHLIAHKPGPSTCSNNFWLSHLSRFASMCGWAAGDEPTNERPNERTFAVYSAANQFTAAESSLTKRNGRFIKTNFDARHGQPTNSWLSNSNDSSRCRCKHFPLSTLYLIYLIYSKQIWVKQSAANSLKSSPLNLISKFF